MASNVARMVEVDSLQFADNVRTPECLAIPAIVESYRRHGFKVNHPLVVSEKPGEGEDGPMYLVLCGNRRGLGLQWLRENDGDTYQRILPQGKVPAIVHKGLTREEETELRIDHSADEDRMPLDEWSVYCAIKQLVQVGIDTQERIAIKLGLFKTTGKNAGQPRREYVQQRTNLVRLPQFVEDEFRKLTLDKDATPVRWSQIPGLYKAFNEEFIDYPDGDGPKFREVWEKITTPPQPTDSEKPGDKQEPKELSPADAKRRAQSASSRGLQQALLCVTRQSGKDLSEIDAHLVAAESALQTLQDIQAYLGSEEYASLIDAATKQGNDRRAAEKGETESAEGTENAEEVHAAA